jgi:hypothetical protein
MGASASSKAVVAMSLAVAASVGCRQQVAETTFLALPGSLPQPHQPLPAAPRRCGQRRLSNEADCQKVDCRKKCHKNCFKQQLGIRAESLYLYES